MPELKTKIVAAKSKLSDFPTVEAAIADWTKRPEFLRKTRQQRIESIRALEGRYQEAIAKKGQALSEAQNGPDMVGRANEAIGQWLDQNIGYDTGKVTRALLPSSDAQAAIDATMFVLPGGEALKGLPLAARLLQRPLGRLVARLGIPTAAGAVGGAISGDPLGGAESGLAQGAIGETLAGVTKTGRHTLGAYDFARLRGWLEARLPIKIPNEQAFRRLFRGGEALKKTEDVTNKEFSSVGNFPVEVTIPQSVSGVISKNAPSGTYRVLLKEVTDILNRLEEVGWDYRNEPTKGHVAKAVRSAVHQIEGEVAQSIDKVSPKSAIRWYTARQKLRTARTLTNMFSEEGAIDESGRLMMPKLQKLVSDAGPKGFKTDIIQSMGDSSQRSLSSILHRGASEGLEDVAGQGVAKHGSLGLHFGVFPRMSLQMPKFARHIGFVPYDLGRGRALTAALTLGPYRFARAVDQLFTGSANAQTAASNQLPPTKIVQDPSRIQMNITKSPEEMAAMPK